MRKTILAATIVAFALAATPVVSDVSVTGDAELGLVGGSDRDVMLHKDVDVTFGMSRETDTGLVFGATIDLSDVGTDYDMKGSVFFTSLVGTLTLGDTDGAFDKALEEVAIGDTLGNVHEHVAYSGNDGLDGKVNGHVLRYDNTLGGVTASLSGEFDSEDANNYVYGVGVAWAGDVGSVELGAGLGWQAGEWDVDSTSHALTGCVKDLTFTLTNEMCPTNVDYSAELDYTDYTKQEHEANVLGASVSAHMDNGLSVVANYSRMNHDTMVGEVDDTMTTSYVGLGLAYAMPDVTVGVNAGSKTTDTNTTEIKSTGVGVAVVYSLGTGVDFQAGVGTGKDDEERVTKWSTGLAFSF